MLVVPYGAGLGIDDVLLCSGQRYTIDSLTDPANGTVVKTPNDFGAFGTRRSRVHRRRLVHLRPFQGSEVADRPPPTSP